MLFKSFRRIDNGCSPTTNLNGETLYVNYVKGGSAYLAVLNCALGVEVNAIQKRGFCNQVVDFNDGTLRVNGQDVSYHA